MKAVVTETTNVILRGNGGEDIYDLPVTRINFGDGIVGVESCFELDEEERKKVAETGKIYLLCLHPTHPPIAPAVDSIFSDAYKSATTELTELAEHEEADSANVNVVEQHNGLKVIKGGA